MPISLMLAKLNKAFSLKANRFLLKTIDSKGKWRLYTEGFSAEDYAILAIQCQQEAIEKLDEASKGPVGV